MKNLAILFVFVFLFIQCTQTPSNTLTQFSTIDALLAGVYDGEFTGAQLLSHGNLGIGTFNHLDGEMLIVDGKIFQVKADGNVYQPGMDILTPFASVAAFQPEMEIALLPQSDFSSAQHFLDSLLVDLNVFYAFRVAGSFSLMRTRSVPAQQPPYKPLVEITKNQPEFPMQNITGTIVGFRCPAFVQGVNVPGYHWHFIDAAGMHGGHILDFSVDKATVQVDKIYDFNLVLPQQSDAFQQVDLSQDRSHELDKVEK